MGEKIKTLAIGVVLGNDVEIELNHPLTRNSDEQIHIQSNKLRLEMSKRDYILYATTILSAERRLKIIKGIK